MWRNTKPVRSTVCFLLEIEIYCRNSCEIRGKNNIFDQKMGFINVFDRKDVLGWLLKMKAKLISKGYKSVLTDIPDQEL